jgi:hypothetical protein
MDFVPPLAGDSDIGNQMGTRQPFVHEAYYHDRCVRRNVTGWIVMVAIAASASKKWMKTPDTK